MTQLRIPKVLIADDEPHIRLLMKRTIKAMQWQVVAEAKNGVEAVELFKENSPDICLLDISMPIKTGMEALEEILAINPSACVIMLTSMSDRESINQSMELGAFHYIRKDTPLDEIKSILIEAWEEYQLEQERIP